MGDAVKLKRSLEERGQALETFLSFTLADFLEIESLAVTARDVEVVEPGDHPTVIPNEGILLTHHGTLASPAEGPFVLGWFIGSALAERLIQVAGGPEPAQAKCAELASALADVLATDKYSIGASRAAESNDLWQDYLAGELPARTFFLLYQLTAADETGYEMVLCWPEQVLERLFGPPPIAAPPESAQAAAEVPKKSPAPGAVERPAPDEPAPVGVQRVLKTEVPVIVSLASQDFPANVLVDMSMGAIIEFNRDCNEPLILSVNNLPIGFGEAVKVGDHFGLKVTKILPLAERVRKLGGKWKY